MSDLRALGARAEDRAADYLVGQGYTIVTRRHKTRRGEIEIVALDGDQLVFVEVKFRRAPGYRPEDSVGKGKMSALTEAAALYVLAMEIQPESYRFDLIAIDSAGLRHHVDLLKP